MRRGLLVAIPVVCAVALLALASTPGPSRVTSVKTAALAALPAGEVACQALGCPGSPPDPVLGCSDGQPPVNDVCGDGSEPPTTTTTQPAPVLPPAAVPAAAPQPAPPVQDAPTPPSAATQSFPSQGWWDAIEQCESGGQNGWRTGYFGIEDPNMRVGDLSYADQLAYAQRIFAASGPGAWGCTATVGAPY